MYGPDGAGQYCYSVLAGLLRCESNDVVGDVWIEIETFGVTSDAAAAALRTSVIDGVSAAATVAQVWAPPAGTLPLPTDCGGLVPFSIVTSAFGSTSPISSYFGGGGWSLDAGAYVNAGVVSCSWANEDSDVGLGGIRSLAAGAWAWNEARPAMTTPGTPAILPIAGLEGSDQAWIRCTPANTECVVDLVIGGNWIEFFLFQDGGVGLFISDLRGAATTIAQGVVATLRP